MRRRWYRPDTGLAFRMFIVLFLLAVLWADGLDFFTLAVVAATRYTMEQCFEEAKGETGLDHYDVRHWTSWYRQITLSMLARAWLAAIRSTEEAKRGHQLQSWRG